MMHVVYAMTDSSFTTVPVTKPTQFPAPPPMKPPLKRILPDGIRQILTEESIIAQNFLIINGLARMKT